MPVSPYFAGQLLKFARLVVQTHKERISTQYQGSLARGGGGGYRESSKPGEYNWRRTGNLRRSTVVRPRSVAAVASTGQVSVGFLQRAWYGVTLEYEMQRLGLGKTIEDVIKTRVKGGQLPKGVTWTRNRETL